MKKWVGSCEELPLYEFLVTEREEKKYDCRIEYLYQFSTFSFPSLAAVRSFLRREYGKVSLKAIKN
jgi:hypothetical protein